MVCADEYLEAVIKALKQSHPYEEPAFYVVKVNDFKHFNLDTALG